MEKVETVDSAYTFLLSKGLSLCEIKNIQNIFINNFKKKERLKMSLRDKIVEDRRNALKEGNITKKNLLGTLLVEVECDSKNPTDDETLRYVKKMIEANIECKTEFENEFLECYLPKMLTDEEITKLITDQITENNYSGMSNLGKIMKYLSTNYYGKYDGKTVSELTKKLLK